MICLASVGDQAIIYVSMLAIYLLQDEWTVRRSVQ